jgi:hypothetical protein
MKEDHPPSRYLFIIADKARAIGKEKAYDSEGNAVFQILTIEAIVRMPSF